MSSGWPSELTDEGLGPTLEMPGNEMISKLKFLSSRAEAGNVRTFVFETGGLEWIAGQAQAYTFPEIGEKEEENERWFTIASAPEEGEIHISTRVTASKFKQTLNAMRPGDEIQFHGLEGDFTWEEDSVEPVVFVAGGIGITPFRSILKSRKSRGKQLNATLLYFNRGNEVPFWEELKVLQAENPEFKIEIIVGEPISADAILSHAPQSAHQEVYLSGPEPMVEKVGADLREKGISVKQDWFPGYDEKNY